MNILIIKSSPHKKGSSNLLAENFIRGAEEKGHQVSIFDAGHAKLHPCLGCDACHMNGLCIQKDDMTELRSQILDSDMAVFVTPIYYFGMSAQLKTVIDRFYSFNSELMEKALKTMLIAAAWDSNDWTMKDISAHYETLCRYLNFKDQGQILGIGCGNVSMTKSTEFPEQAYRLGKTI
ncbi:Putative NAD(P)H-dependent FMN-containing oxidoreductase ywqN [uncultured Roseburia sp.]|uniref:Flavodoxin family protein n=1 Tax=Brotonthovivens ammoniilytica TaxID=2981725 RepID=A0ABT2TMY0_9FIRM|nr:flavodoxin family protein [Brotonthovivens ammoniilytica]MCU6763593.1 flavodoxin family protein [Brotonthovivens ammoniilytica]SCJ26199.1 Putative NAD(P)H-dependent FMN-containing oxidoreductase ywqN [uncultured Roseburia sp.]